MSADAQDRLADARSTVSMLFPSAELQRRGPRGRSGPPERTFVVAPSMRHPRLLIPRRPRQAAAVALRSYGGRLSMAGTWGYRGFGAAMALTGGRSLGPTYTVASDDGVRRPGIDDHLAGVLGEPVSVAFHLTPARANRKPVLQALAAGRRTPAAFVKVGTSPLTKTLAAAEANALREIAANRPGSIITPEVIDFSEFNGLSVLALSSLPTWQAGRLPHQAEVLAATAAVAAIGPHTAGPMSESGRWERLQTELDAAPATAVYDRLRRALAQLHASASAVEVETGASHGDWSPWNMWWTDGALLVWDWERFAAGVPIGSDLVHYHLQQIMVDGGDLLSAARTVIDEAPGRLRSAVADPVAARLTAVVHLIALALRYEGDGQGATGSRIGQIQEWLLPAIEAHVAGVPEQPRTP